MSKRAAITVDRAPEEVERLWRSADHRAANVEDAQGQVTFKAAPGDRGTEIHVELRSGTSGGTLGEAVQKVLGSEPLAKVKDDLRRFKQHVETGEIVRSDAAPDGELAERKPKQRPAQPLDPSELEKVGS